jgi:hypothetical protein
VHVYGGVSLYTNDLGQTCYLPDYDLETAAIDNYIQLIDYGNDYVGEPVSSGYTDSAHVEVTLDITIPETGFAYINQHMDYGLKDRGSNDLGYVKDANEDALLPGTQVDPEPVVLIPELADHGFYTYLGAVELGSDSVQVDNEFKTNPGIAGLVLEIVLDADSFPDEVPLADVLIQLKDQDGNVVGEDLSDEHGWYQIIYKHLGKPTNYTFEAYLSGVAGGPPNFTRVVELKGNEFKEVMMYLDPLGLAAEKVHVGDMDPSIKSGPKTWNTTVSILVVDDGEDPVTNAQVSGEWGGWGVGELGFCVTDAAGLCEVALAKIPNGETVTFTIIDVFAIDYFYDPDANVESTVSMTSP